MEDRIKPMVYEMRIQGHVDKHWFDRLDVSYTENGDTLLIGEIVDQSALYGIIKKVRDLGVTLISVNCIEI